MVRELAVSLQHPKGRWLLEIEMFVEAGVYGTDAKKKQLLSVSAERGSLHVWPGEPAKSCSTLPIQVINTCQGSSFFGYQLNCQSGVEPQLEACIASLALNRQAPSTLAADFAQAIVDPI